MYAAVKKVRGVRTRQGRPIVEAEIFDGTSYLKLTFFNQAWREKQLRPGTEAAFFGRVEHYRGRGQMTNPVVDDRRPAAGRRHRRARAGVPAVGQGRRAHVAAAAARRRLRSRSTQAARLRRSARRGPLLDELGLIDRDRRVPGIHRPAVARRPPRAQRSASRSTSSCACRSASSRASAPSSSEQAGIRHVGRRPARARRSTAGSRSRSTGDQQRAIDEIFRDLAGAAPMHRLLQGEVGSGKTVVALTRAARRGAGRLPGRVHGADRGARRAAHLTSRAPARRPRPCAEATLLGERPVRVELLTNRTRRRGASPHRRRSAGRRGRPRRRHARADLRECQFADLGVAVIDEQHRFGVEQRALLRARHGDEPQARRARDDGDADPAHRGDADLRRPRPVRAPRDARRAGRRSRPR